MRNSTLFGLIARSAISIDWDPAAEAVVLARGIPVGATVVPSTSRAFNLPQWLSVDGARLYPSRYEILTTGTVAYHSSIPPFFGVSVNRSQSGLDEGEKRMQARLSPEILEGLRGRRPRRPSQDVVMKERAHQCAARLVTDGVLTVDPSASVTWHWCHLIAFSFIPASRAQTRRNLVLGTGAANGQLANMESAVRWYVKTFGATVSLEVTATVLLTAPLCVRLRYQVYDRNTKQSHREYFDLESPAPADVSEYGDLAYRLADNLL